MEVVSYHDPGDRIVRLKTYIFLYQLDEINELSKKMAVSKASYIRSALSCYNKFIQKEIKQGKL